MRTVALFGFPLGRAAAIAGSAAAVALFAGCGDSGSGDAGNAGGGGSAATESSTASTDGAQVFKQNCASCHTLAAAGGEGRIGPNLDEEKPDAGKVTEYVTNGEGSMPAFSKRLSAEQIKAVSDYVAEVAGQ